ncbi:diaminopimelate decarboxylase [Bowdeniella nasicola]|uniref:Diaminopimelate decarboxylase n=1 Tax=Bowdeniella nasicola TaxID=208480 RepID=A0A1Q5Q2Z8_9ACTO|nr:diaminopimelate decarboxylase [Bowdeniella nasicola]OKL54214.1 diaminopimelate decarboxylase [Bowdeniella nasicola]
MNAPSPLRCPEPAERPDIWPTTARRSDVGVLSIGGVELTYEALAAAGGPEEPQPVVICDAAAATGRATVWQMAMSEAFWDGYGMNGARVYYAGKAFLCAALVRALTDAGLGIDTASLGELTLALRAGANPATVGLHGNAKSDAEIDFALCEGIGRIIIDSLPEIDRIVGRARALGVEAPLMVRVTTGVHAGGHTFIATAHEDQKFGLSLATGAARAAAEKIAAADGVRLVGLHSHIGSQIMELDGFAAAARAVLTLRHELQQAGIAVPEVDLGGGYGVAYTERDAIAPTQKQVADELAAIVRTTCADLGSDVPVISIEPGRSIIAPTCVSLYPVVATKDVMTEDGFTRRYVAVDGGMSDNIRPVLYDAAYSATLANRDPNAAPAHVRTRVVGKHCESGDILIPDALLPGDVAPGDIIAVPVTGAYGRAMASNYNMATRPGVLAVAGGAATWWLRPETIDDLLALDPGL